MVKLRQIITGSFPFKCYTALTIYPFVFVRKDRAEKYTKKVERHETTHALQQAECLFLLFFLIYALEWIIKLPFCKFNRDRAYMSISFEQEAYEHQEEVYYNEVRRHYAWAKYLFTLKS